MDISSLLEVQVDEGQSSTAKEEVINSKLSTKVLKASEIISPEEAAFYLRMFGDGISQVRFERIHCTGCDVHIGSALSDAYNMQEHPTLKTLLCATCREFYGDGNFEQGDDATDMFCRWCANGGHLYCCSYCSNTFCDKCIKRNFTSDVQKKIEDDEKWKCFVCDPTDLYGLRSICRALQQHVKTLSKILRADKSMTPKEIEEKMEQDDTKCCAGRRSRRRRRESTSADDRSSSSRSRSPSQLRNRSRKRKKPMILPKPSNNELENSRIILNGTSNYIPLASHYVLQQMVPAGIKVRSEEDDIPPPLLQCEQTMIEGDGETVTPQGKILPLNVNSGIPESILYNTAISLNPIPSQTITRGAITRGGKTGIIPIRPLRRLETLPRGMRPQIIHRLPAGPGRPNAPMVTIPKARISTGGTLMTIHPNRNQNSTIPAVPLSNFLRCKNNLTAEPSVIDLESDSEELVIVEPSPSATTNISEQRNQMTDDSGTQTDNNIFQSTVPHRRKIFQDNIDNPLTAIDDLLVKLRDRLQQDLERVVQLDDDNEIANTSVKLRIINRNVSRIMSELAAFNNTMIQQYKPWKKNYLYNDADDDTEPIVLEANERSSKYGSLDLVCSRDSEPELDDDEDANDDDVDHLLNYPRMLRHLLEKETVNVSCHTAVETEEKAVQVYEPVEDEDYDKSIGYSLLMRADYDNQRRKEVFKPVMIHDIHFGKYEEEFISYLQVFEDRRCDIDNNCAEDGASQQEATQIEIIDAELAQKAEEKKDDELEEKEVVQTSVEEIHSPKLLTSININTNEVPISVNGHDDSHNEEAMEIDQVTEPMEMESIQLINPYAKADKVIPSNEESNKTIVNNETNTNVLPITETAVSELVTDETNVEFKASQEAKHEETVIAVRALIEKESDDLDRWKIGDEDECTILD